MAKASARRSLAPTAASTRKPRRRPQVKSSPLKKAVTPAKTATPAKSLKKAAPVKSNVAAKFINSGILKKRSKRRQSVASKALKLKEAARVRRASKKGAKVEIEAGNDEDAVNAPEPTKVYNDHFKTSGLEWDVEEILDSKMKKDPKSKEDLRWYLVKWVGYPRSASTWEPEENLRNAFDKITDFDDANPGKA